MPTCPIDNDDANNVDNTDNIKNAINVEDFKGLITNLIFYEKNASKSEIDYSFLIDILFKLNEEEIKNAPEGFETKNAVGAKGLNYRIAVDVLDCTGCGNCAEVCPAKEKALIMKPIETQMDKQEIWDYAKNEVKVKKNPMKKVNKIVEELRK